MILDWFGKAREPESVADLIARRRYDRALEVLREHFEAGRRDLDLRIQYADVLVLDQRASEAAPILLGVADELLAKGAPDRAQEILTRLEEIDPGNPETAARWDTLATTEPDASTATAGDEAPSPPSAPLGDADPAPALLAAQEHAGRASAPERSAESAASDDAVVVDAIWYDSEEVEEQPTPAVEAAPQFIAPDDWDEDLASSDGEAVVDWVESLLGRLPSPDGARRAPGVLLGALFESIPRGEIRELARGLHRRGFAAGEVAVAEGADGTSLFVLSEGRVRVSVRSPSGHHFPLAELAPGEFFGEVAALSGRARCASVTALTAVEALEIDRPALDRLTRRNARAKGLLENACVERALSPDAAAVRAVPADATAERADRILEGFFGLRQASPRLRLRLASALLKAGNDRQVLPVLAELAEELAGAGQSRKALAILRRIEALAHRDIHELCLAPLERDKPALPASPEEDEDRPIPPPVREGRSRRPLTFQDGFQSWLRHVSRESDDRSLAGGGPPAARP